MFTLQAGGNRLGQLRIGSMIVERKLNDFSSEDITSIAMQIGRMVFEISLPENMYFNMESLRPEASPRESQAVE